MSDFTVKHRAILQAFLSRKTFQMPDLKELFAAVFSVERDVPFSAASFPEAEIRIMLLDIDDQLTRFDLGIKSIHDQHDRTEIWALVNLASDTVIQSATHHTPEEIAFFRRVLDAMFETNNQRNAEVFAVKRGDAERLHKAPREERTVTSTGEGQATASAPKGLTMYEAQQALAAFVEEGWLERSKNQWYTLAPRALLELSDYLKTIYDPEPDPEDSADAPAEKFIKTCHLCTEILTIGQRCDDYDCPLRMHNPCAKVLFERTPEPHCPRCKKPWSGESPVGEKAASRLHIRRPGGGGARRASGMSRAADTPGEARRTSIRRGEESDDEDLVDGDEEDDDNEEEEAEPEAEEDEDDE